MEIYDNEKIIIKSDDVFFLFSDVIGGADIDDVYDQYGSLNLELSSERALFIHNCLLSVYEKMTKEQKSNLRFSLYYFAFHACNLIKEEWPSYLFPFSFPDDVERFLREIWAAIFGESGFSLEGIEFSVERV